jgi:hypothetical protein
MCSSIKIERPSTSKPRFELTISNSRDPRLQRPLKAEKQAASDSDVVRTMLSLIAGYDHNSALTSLSFRVPRYSRGRGKSRDIATVPPDP